MKISSNGEASKGKKLILVLSIFFGLLVFAPTLLAPNRFELLPDNNSLECPKTILRSVGSSCGELQDHSSPMFFAEYKGHHGVKTNLVLQMAPIFSKELANGKMKLEYEMSILYFNKDRVVPGDDVRLEKRQAGEIDIENRIRYQIPLEIPNYLVVVKFLNQDALIDNNVKSVEYKALVLNPEYQEILIKFQNGLASVLGVIFLYSLWRGIKASPVHTDEVKKEKPNAIYRLLGILFIQGFAKRSLNMDKFLVEEVYPTAILVLYVGLTLLYFTSCLNRLASGTRSTLKSKIGINICILLFTVLLGLENFYLMEEAREKNGFTRFASSDPVFVQIKIAAYCTFGLIYLWNLLKVIKIIRSENSIDYVEKARFFFIQLSLCCFGFLFYAQGLHMYNLYTENPLLLLGFIGFIVFGVEIIYMPEKANQERGAFYMPTPNEKNGLHIDSPTSPTLPDNEGNQSELHGDTSVIEGI